MIDVLLVSPRLPKGDPRRCGDNSYTDLLLEHPPQGVHYRHYEDLIAAGAMRRIRSLQHGGYYLTKYGVLPPDLWAEYLESSYRPDLVHVVALAATVRLPRGNRVPVILHASSPSITDLAVKRGWTPRQIRHAYARERVYLRVAQAHHYALNADHAITVLVQSEYGRRLLTEYGAGLKGKVRVLYPAQPMPEGQANPRSRDDDTVTFLFVGTDFDRKNGQLVVEAFRRVRGVVSKTRLILVGRPGSGRTYVEPGVTHLQFVPHDQLLSEIMPQSDVFVLPTNAEGSFAFTVFEALAHGLPVISVDAWALPEIIDEGSTGYLIAPNSLDDLVQCMLRLAEDSELRGRMARNCLRVFSERFSIEAHNRQLLEVYQDALDESVLGQQRRMLGAAHASRSEVTHDG